VQFTEFQTLIRETDQRPGGELEDITVHLLGLAGEAGSVAAEYKKKLRDRGAHPMWKARMRAELGDVLWYVAAVANKIGLDLDDIAQTNLEKTRGRWLATAVEPFDASYPDHEHLPRSGVLEFRPTESVTGRPAVEIYLDGMKRGDLLTDSSNVDDGYRFHDVFHLAYATVLGWSPVLRALLKCKRKSNPLVDENEDGGRAIVVEEGVAALVFAYATEHNYLDGIKRIDFRFLETIQLLVSEKEVGVRSAADWEMAILAGFDMFRRLVVDGGGVIHFDADERTLTYSNAESRSAPLRPSTRGRA
jgi:NTP pyrophosphatase (non-canonical NTP hydrolase)